MADYHKSKRKRVRDIKSHITVSQNNIKMTSTEKPENLRVVRSRKSIRRANRIVYLGVAFALAVVLFLINLFTPTGIIENVQVVLASLKISNASAQISGSQIISAYKQHNDFFVLTDTSLQSFSNSGKCIKTFFHGYSNPLMDVSAIRCVVFDQGKDSISVYNAAKEVLTLKTDNEIYAAAVARNGVFAVSTKSDSYASQITVYSKRGEPVYSWSSPGEIVNNITISNNGKFLAFSAVKSENGNLISNIYILKIGSASYDYSKTYEGYIYSVDTFNNSAITVVAENNIDLIKFKNHTVNSFTTDTYIQNSVNYRNKSYIISALSGESSEFYLDILSSNGVNKLHTKVSTGITDYAVNGGYQYILSENKVLVIDSKGRIVKSADCEYGYKKIIPISSSVCYLINDTHSEKTLLKKVEIQ